MLAIQKQPGTNTVAVVDSIKKLLPRLQEHIPAAVQINTLYDRSVSIRASVDDVKFTLLLTIGLVVMVIFIFLRNISATNESRIYKDCEFLRIQTQRSSGCLGCFLSRVGKLGMNRHSRNLDSSGSNSKI